VADSMFGKQFARRVERHTEEAREKFQSCIHLDRDLPDTFYWLSVLLEEVGKLSRACNKLAIAADSDVQAQWGKEAQHRLLTIASMARRMAERWDEIPQRPALAAETTLLQPEGFRG
jgi:hypothetical protein